MQGLAVLDLLRNFTDATISQFYRDPGTAPDVMNAFLNNITDPAIKALQEKAEAGNWNATMQLQQKFFDAQFGESRWKKRAYVFCEESIAIELSFS